MRGGDILVRDDGSARLRQPFANQTASVSDEVGADQDVVAARAKLDPDGALLQVGHAGFPSS